MVEENKQRREELGKAFRSTEQKTYWELWHKHRGNLAKVAAECGVTKGTVSDHISVAAVAMGFANAAHARRHFGFGSRSSRSDDFPDAVDLRRLLQMQDYKCALTGVRLEPENPELDHKTPLSRGGSNAIGNLQWIQKEVNRAKGTMDNEEFIAMCQKVSRHGKK